MFCKRCSEKSKQFKALYTACGADFRQKWLKVFNREYPNWMCLACDQQIANESSNVLVPPVHNEDKVLKKRATKIVAVKSTARTVTQKATKIAAAVKSTELKALKATTIAEEEIIEILDEATTAATTTTSEDEDKVLKKSTKKASAVKSTKKKAVSLAAAVKPTQLKALKATKIAEEEIIEILDEATTATTTTTTSEDEDKVLKKRATKIAAVKSTARTVTQKPTKKTAAVKSTKKKAVSLAAAVKSTELKVVKATKIAEEEIIEILDEATTEKPAAATTTETAKTRIRKPDKQYYTDVALANGNKSASNINYDDDMKKFDNHYECNLCIISKCYAYKQSLKFHIRTQHYGENPFQCRICETSTKFRNSNELLVHIKIHHSGYRFICNICDFRYYSKMSLVYHFKAAHNKQPQVTFRFEIPQTKNNDFNRSVKRFPNHYQCAHCTYTNQYHGNSLLAHIMTKHYGYKYKCNHCKKSYTRHLSIKKHLKIVHKNCDGNAFEILKPPKRQKVNKVAAAAEDSIEILEDSNSAQEIKREELQFEEYSFSYDTIADESMPIMNSNIAESSSPAIFNDPTNKPDDSTTTGQKSKTQKVADETFQTLSDFNDTLDEDDTTAKNYDALTGIQRKILFKYSKAYSSSGKFYHCKLCIKSRKLFQFSTIRRHIKFQHFSIQFQCTKCAKQLAQPLKLRKHYAAQHGINGPNKMQLCLFRKPNLDNKLKQISKFMRKNIYRNSNETGELLQVVKEQSKEHSSELKKLQPHYIGCKSDLSSQQHSGGRPVAKQRCNFSSSIRKLGNSYQCVHCEFSKQYWNKTTLRSHIKLKHYGYRYICQECECSYASRDSIVNHLKLKHNISDNANALRIGIPVKAKMSNVNENSATDGYRQNIDFSIAESEASFKPQHQPCQSTCQKSKACLELQYQPFQSASCQQRLSSAPAVTESESSLTIENSQLAVLGTLTSSKPSQVTNYNQSLSYATSVAQSMDSIHSSQSTNGQHLSNIAANSEYMALIKLQHQPYQNNAFANLDSGPSLQLQKQTRNSQHIASLQSHQTHKIEENSEATSALQYQISKKARITPFKYSTAYKRSGKSYLCKLCAKSRKFFQFSAIIQHIKFQHFTISFQCTNCTEQLAQPSKLRKHYAQQHGTKSPQKLKTMLIRIFKINKMKRISKENQNKQKSKQTANSAVYQQSKEFEGIKAIKQEQIDFSEYFLSCDNLDRKNLSKYSRTFSEETSRHQSEKHYGAASQNADLLCHNKPIEFCHKVIKQEEIDFNEYDVYAKSEHNSTSSTISDEFLDEDVTTSSSFQQSSFVLPDGIDDQQLEFRNKANKQEEFIFGQDSLDGNNPAASITYSNLITADADALSLQKTIISLEMLPTDGSQQLEFSNQVIKQEEFIFEQDYLGCDNTASINTKSDTNSISLEIPSDVSQQLQFSNKAIKQEEFIFDPARSNPNSNLTTSKAENLYG